MKMNHQMKDMMEELKQTEDEKQEDDESTPRKEKKSTHEDTPHPKTKEHQDIRNTRR